MSLHYNPGMIELPHHPLLQRGGIEVLNVREGPIYDLMFPLDYIKDDDVPVDDEHVQQLSDLFQEEEDAGNPQGQRVAILLAYLEDEPNWAFIEDGFHRRRVLTLRQKTHAYASLRRAKNMEEIHKQRIKLALSNEVVEFPRLWGWTLQMWNETIWAKQFGLNLGQAFKIATTVRHSLPAGLPRTEVEPIRIWFTDSCEVWQKEPKEVRRELQKAYGIDPEIVAAVRDRENSEVPVISSSHLNEISKALPFAYDMQRIVRDAVLEYGLNIRQTRELCLALEYAESAHRAFQIRDAKLASFRAIATARPVTTSHGIAVPRRAQPLGQTTANSIPRLTGEFRTYEPPETEEDQAAKRLIALLRMESVRTGTPLEDLVIRYVNKYGGVSLVRENTRTRLEDLEVTIPTALGIFSFNISDHSYSSPLLKGKRGESLTPTEARILAVLCSDPGRVFKQYEILQKVWGEEYGNEAHLLRVNMARLRAKLGDDKDGQLIVTIPAIGYKINALAA